MKPLLIILCTAVCTLAGWHLGSTSRTPRDGIAVGAVVDGQALRPAVEGQSAVVRRPLDVKATMDRLLAEVATLGREQKDTALAARICPAFQDLPDNEFQPAVETLISAGQADAAALLAGLWAERDLPAARDWALRLGPMTPGPAVEVFLTWAQRDTPGMFGWLETQTGDANSAAITDVVSRILPDIAAAHDPERGLRLIAALQSDKAGVYYRVPAQALFRSWAALAPEAAAARALGEPDESERANAVTMVALGWKDHDAARAWVEKLADPILGTNTLAELGRSIGQNDPVTGVDFLMSLPLTDRTREHLSTTVDEWSRQDFRSAINWVAGLDNTVVARSLFAKISLSRSQDQIERVISQLPAEQRAQAEQWLRESNAPTTSAVKTGL